jgi:hypothetical protein
MGDTVGHRGHLQALTGRADRRRLTEAFTASSCGRSHRGPLAAALSTNPIGVGSTREAKQSVQVDVLSQMRGQRVEHPFDILVVRHA